MPALDTCQTPAWKEWSLVLFVWFLGSLALLWASLGLTGGQLIYCLDDPYIHLAVAQGIWDGTYGVNPGEASSPSSSALWPLLLLPFVATGTGEFGPLAINLVCGAATACCLGAGLRRAFPRFEGWGLRVLLVVALLLVGNAWALAFMGMEHSLQLLLAVGVVHGLLRCASGAPVTRTLGWATVLGPWVRYENLAVSAAAWVFLAWMGERRRALRWASLCAVGLGLFSLFLVLQGLDALPSSVRMKSGLSGEDWGFWGSIQQHVTFALNSGRGTVLAGFSLVLLVFAAARPTLDPVGKLALCLSGAGALHLLFGVYGWFHRYEAYIFGSLGFAVVALAPSVIPALSERARAQLALVATMVVLAFPYLRSLPQTPAAAHNVFEQQYQLHRFVTEFWKQPVAVNDLGYVAFDNGNYVLDLAGLASSEVQQRRLTEAAPEWIADLTQRHAIDLAVVYPAWFPKRPASWVRVADMTLSGPRVSVAHTKVSFFATNAAAVPSVQRALEAFVPTLPKPEQLVMLKEARE